VIFASNLVLKDKAHRADHKMIWVGLIWVYYGRDIKGHKKVGNIREKCLIISGDRPISGDFPSTLDRTICWKPFCCYFRQFIDLLSLFASVQ
jgi:hypothetical protein